MPGSIFRFCKLLSQTEISQNKNLKFVIQQVISIVWLLSPFLNWDKIYKKLKILYSLAKASSTSHTINSCLLCCSCNQNSNQRLGGSRTIDTMRSYCILQQRLVTQIVTCATKQTQFPVLRTIIIYLPRMDGLDPVRDVLNSRRNECGIVSTVLNCCVYEQHLYCDALMAFL
jgi:hypothetical protein